MTNTELRKLRESRNLSRTRLSCIMTAKYHDGFSAETIKKWETGEFKIPGIKAMALRKELD